MLLVAATVVQRLSAAAILQCRRKKKMSKLSFNLHGGRLVLIPNVSQMFIFLPQHDNVVVASDALRGLGRQAQAAVIVLAGWTLCDALTANRAIAVLTRNGRNGWNRR